MLLIRHVAHLLFDLCRQAVSTRRVGVLVLAVLGLVVVAIGTALTVGAPMVVYPFV